MFNRKKKKEEEQKKRDDEKIRKMINESLDDIDLKNRTSKEEHVVNDKTLICRFYVHTISAMDESGKQLQGVAFGYCMN